jgi:hypothetical protein
MLSRYNHWTRAGACLWGGGLWGGTTVLLTRKSTKKLEGQRLRAGRSSDEGLCRRSLPRMRQLHHGAQWHLPEGRHLRWHDGVQLRALPSSPRLSLCGEGLRHGLSEAALGIDAGVCSGRAFVGATCLTALSSALSWATFSSSMTDETDGWRVPGGCTGN